MKRKSPLSLNTGPDFFSKEVEQERVFFHETRSQRGELEVLCGGKEHCRRDYRIDRKDFPYFCLEYVVQGKGSLLLSGKEHGLNPGSLFCYGPGNPHLIRTDTENRLVKYFVDFQGSSARQLLKSHHILPPSFRQIPLSRSIPDIFDSLIEAGRGQLPSGRNLERLLLEALLLLATEKYPAPPQEQSRAFQTYRRCADFMEHHFRKLDRVEDLARACHVDAAYLTRLFARFGTGSPHRALSEMKMKAAALSLVRNGSLVKEVSEEFGYTDPFHFSKTFKRIHGVSPENYLRRHVR